MSTLTRPLSALDRISTGLIQFVALLVCIGSVNANALAGSISLYDTSGSKPVSIAGSIDGFCGQQNFYSPISDASNNLIATINVAVDYAVFAPGQVSGSALGAAGHTANDGTFSIGNFTASSKDYVYAYQIFNTGDPQSTLSTGLTGLSIGFNGQLAKPVDDSVGETNATLVGAIPYSFTVIENDATLFAYFGGPVLPGQQSYFLLTSSRYSPAYDGTLGYGAYTTNGSGSHQYLSSPNSTLPIGFAGAAPTPLPQSWKQLLFIGITGVVVARFKRNRSSLVPSAQIV